MVRSGFFSQLRARRDITATTIRDALVAHVPAYTALGSARHAALLDEVREQWDMTLQRAQSNAPFTEADLDIFRAGGHSRAQDSFRLGDFRAGLNVSFTSGLRECLSEVSDSDEPLVFLAWGAREEARVRNAQLDAYAVARREMDHGGPARELLVKHLLEGTSVTGAARAAGVPLPDGYLMLLCQPQQSEELATTEHRDMIDHALAAVPGALWRGDLCNGRLLILLPADADSAPARAMASGLVTTLAEIVGQRLYSAEAHAVNLADVPDAYDEVQQTTALVVAMPDVENRPYRTDELLVELAVASQPMVRRRLVDLLAPLRHGTDLMHTLNVLFYCGLDREKATKALYIHRRTLTYRIQRIRDLTGLDPASAHGIQLLRTALTATRLPAKSTPWRAPADWGLATLSLGDCGADGVSGPTRRAMVRRDGHRE